MAEYLSQILVRSTDDAFCSGPTAAPSVGRTIAVTCNPGGEGGVLDISLSGEMWPGPSNPDPV